MTMMPSLPTSAHEWCAFLADEVEIVGDLGGLGVPRSLLEEA